MIGKTRPFGDGEDRGPAGSAGFGGHTTGGAARGAGGKGRRRGQRRSLVVFKAVVLLVLVAVVAYGMLNGGLYTGSLLPRSVAEVLGLVESNPAFDDLWLPVAAFVLGLLFVTLFARGFYEDLPRSGVVLVGLLAALATIKGVSMVWTISETETVKELLRSSAYAAAFLLALGAVASRRQVGPLVDIAVLLIAAVAGYGLLQKISPAEYEITSVDGVTIDSTLGYSNTVAVVLGMGVVLALSRMAATAPEGAVPRNAALRGLYAALVLAFLAALPLTVSRGGIASLLVGLAFLFLLSKDRLQLFANGLLVALPAAWLYWQMRGLDALFAAGVPDAQKIADGADLRNYVLLALAAAFVLQAAYASLAGRYELTPAARRSLGALAVVAVVLAAGAGAYVVAGGSGETGGGQGEQGQGSGGRGERAGRGEGTGQALLSTSVGFREEYWRVAWEAWKERPLAGTGAGTFHYTWLQDRDSTQGVRQVHNLYLEQGTETGVFAFLALLGFAAVLVWHAATAALRSDPGGSGGAAGERRPLLAGLASALVIYLVSSFFEWHWYIPGATLFFFFLAGVAVKYASMRGLPNGEAAADAPGNGR